MTVSSAFAVVGSFVSNRMRAVSELTVSTRTFEIVGEPAWSRCSAGPGRKAGPPVGEMLPLAASANPWLPVRTAVALTVMV